MKNIISTAIRAIIGIALAVYLIRRVISYSGVDIQAEVKRCAGEFLIIAFLCYGFVLIICVYRWKLLLDVQGISVRFFKLIELSMVGLFFNLVIPGAVSGDIIKMVYISGHSSGKTAEAVLTIMLDRVIGLFGLLLVASIAVLLSTKFLMGASTEIQVSAFVIGGGSLIGIVAILGVVFRKQVQSLFGVRQVIAVLKQWTPDGVMSVLRRLITALEFYKNARITVVYAILLSVTIHSILALSIFSIGKGFHEDNLTLKNYFLATQVANAIGAIPITPSGFGSRDFALSLSLTESGADAEKAGIIPPFFSIVMAFWSLIGGVFFIFHKRKVSRNS